MKYVTPILNVLDFLTFEIHWIVKRSHEVLAIDQSLTHQ